MPMWEKLNRYGAVIICGRGGIDELVTGKTENFGMSECYRVKALMVKREGDLWSTSRGNKGVENLSRDFHDDSRTGLG